MPNISDIINSELARKYQADPFYNHASPSKETPTTAQGWYNGWMAGKFNIQAIPSKYRQAVSKLIAGR